MKKFIFNSPLQKEGSLRCDVYQAVGNKGLQMDRGTSFPIIPVIRCYAGKDEEFRVISVVQKSDDPERKSNSERNFGTFLDEFEKLCLNEGWKRPRNGIETVCVTTDQSVPNLVTTFQRLLDYLDDDDDLYACISYGTKAMPMALLYAMNYACRLKKNARITCVVYGDMDWNVNPPTPKIYDVTALVKLDEITGMLANMGVEDPKRIIDRMLEL